jgi:hypothetical protein
MKAMKPKPHFTGFPALGLRLSAAFIIPALLAVAVLVPASAGRELPTGTETAVSITDAPAHPRVAGRQLHQPRVKP